MKSTSLGSIALTFIATSPIAAEQARLEPIPWSGITLRPDRAARVDRFHRRISDWKEVTHAPDGPSACVLWAFDSFDADPATLAPLGGDLCRLPGPAWRWFSGPAGGDRRYQVAQRFNDMSGIAPEFSGQRVDRAVLGVYFNGNGVDVDPNKPGVQEHLSIIVSIYDDWSADDCLIPQEFLSGLVFEFDAVDTDLLSYSVVDLDQCGDRFLFWTLPRDGAGSHYVAFGTYQVPGAGPPYSLTGAQGVLWGTCAAGGSTCRATTRGPGTQDARGLDDDRAVIDPGVGDCGPVGSDGLFDLEDLFGTDPVLCECYDFDLGLCPNPLGDMIGFLSQRAQPPCECAGDIAGPGPTDPECAVCQSDLGVLLSSYGRCEGDPLYKPEADIVPGAAPGTPCALLGRSGVDQQDLGLLLSQYDGLCGAACP
jgi:hypothetical protein